MSCPRDSSDKLMTVLLEQGINLVLPPRDNIQPGDLIISDEKGAARPASWREIFNLGFTPKIEDDSGFRSFVFKASSVLKVGVAASVMGRILQAFGLGSGA